MSMEHEKHHRIIDEINKKIAKGQILQFLTGDGISSSDKYFYSLRYGVCSLLDTISLYYMKETGQYEYLVHVVHNGEDKVNCYKAEPQAKYGLQKVDFEDLVPSIRTDSRHGRRSKTNPAPNRQNIREKQATDKEETQQQADESTKDFSEDLAKLNKLTQCIEEDRKKIIILVENFEWVAKLHNSPPDTDWIARLQDSRWKQSNKLLTLVTMRNMEKLADYGFAEEETFIPSPDSREIGLAYLRHIIVKSQPEYKLDYKELDVIANSMARGKKSLLECIRVLDSVLQKNPSELKAESFQESAEQNIEEQVEWDEVILDLDTKNKIRRAVKQFMDSTDSKGRRKGIVFTGPPGTGKTMIAKALANMENCYFMAPTLADMKGKYVGHSSANIKKIFAEARSQEKTILFIDEADTVFPARDMNSSSGDSFGLDMVNQFLMELDGAKSGTQKIFTIAATNRIHAIDRAILSRLSDVPIEIGLPDGENRIKIFNKRLKPFSLENVSFKDMVQQKSAGMSGRDIDNFVKKLKEVISTEQLDDNEDTREFFQRLFSEREHNFLMELKDQGVVNYIKPPEDIKLKSQDVIGYENLKTEIQKQIAYIKETNKAKYNYYKIKSAKGILLYGPPGNAKTMLAEAMASEAGFYFVKIVSQDFVSTSAEQQVRKLTAIFQEISKFSQITNAPGVVLFFDEFDSLASKFTLSETVRGTLLTFLADEHGIRHPDSKILLMAATNFFSHIDDAVKRRGRFDVHLFMDNPSEEDGKALLRQLFHQESNSIKQPDQNLIDAIYEQLKDDVKPEHERQVMEELFGVGRTKDMLDELQLKIVEKRMKECRPSGADIKYKYLALKEEAFLSQNPTGEEKLEIILG